MEKFIIRKNKRRLDDAKDNNENENLCTQTLGSDL